MKIRLKEIIYYNGKDQITAGITFDLKNLLSAIKGRATVMMNRTYSDRSFELDCNELVTLVEESVIRAELSSILKTDNKELTWKPVRLCD